jgi:hypothetical protein
VPRATVGAAGASGGIRNVIQAIPRFEVGYRVRCSAVQESIVRLRSQGIAGELVSDGIHVQKELIVLNWKTIAELRMREGVGILVALLADLAIVA